MDVIVARAAAKALSDLPPKDAAALIAKIEAVAAAPNARHPWAKAFSATAGRIRHGDWRAVYRIDRKALLLLIEAIGHRREIYR